jgi:hypothetical protein
MVRSCDVNKAQEVLNLLCQDQVSEQSSRLPSVLTHGGTYVLQNI